MELARHRARLLRFLAGIDLDIAIRSAAQPRHFLGERGRQPLAVDRLDDVEQRHRLARLVGLQGADQVQIEVGIFRLQRREFLLRLLHAGLAEDTLARIQKLAHPIGAMGAWVESLEARFSAGRASSKRLRPRSASPWLLSARTLSGASFR